MRVASLARVMAVPTAHKEGVALAHKWGVLSASLLETVLVLMTGVARDKELEMKTVQVKEIMLV